MKRIKELTDQERELIVNALRDDGFTEVVDHLYMISYQDSEFREYELYSTDIYGDYNYDDFLNISFREKDFFSLMKNKSTIKIGSAEVEGFLKTRHTVSIENKILNEDIDSVVSEMAGWKLENTWSVQDSRSFYAIPDSLEYHHLLIKGKSHLAISDGINGRYECYECNPEAIIDFLMLTPETYALKENLLRVFQEVNKKEDAAI